MFAIITAKYTIIYTTTITTTTTTNTYMVECTQMGGSGCVFVTYFGRRKPT